MNGLFCYNQADIFGRGWGEMMTRLTKTALLTVALLCARVGMAQDAKIAIVDMQRLALGTEEGKKASEKLEKRYQEISTIMQGLQKSIEDKENTLKTQERALSDTRKAQLAREIDNERKEFTRKNEDYQTELGDMEQQLTGPLLDKANATLSAYIKEKGFTIVFNISTENGNVVWFNRGNDVTDDVVKRINAETKTAVTPVKPPATAPSATAPSR
jgi:outer membrane protein